MLAAGLFAATAHARPFRVGEVEGLVNFSLAYGILARVESQEPELVAVGNGGTGPSANIDDGNLNYDTGVVSNMIQATGELALAWRWFGGYVRAVGFYDFENELGDRARTDLDNGATRVVGSDIDAREYYVTGRFTPGGMPIQVRVGNQVINWGEPGFLRFGVDVVNPLDLVAVFQPTTTARDLFLPQGMIWGAANLTEAISVEGFYQYDWEDVQIPPVGTFASANDLFGAGGLGFGMAGFGQFSDLGTNLDAAFGLEPGTLGFDLDFMRIPPGGRKKPDDQGQYGFTVQAILPALNATKLAVHFVNYHSRLPLVNGLTAEPEDVLRTTQEEVDLLAGRLEAEGLDPADASAAAETLTTGWYANDTSYFTVYPENIRMLGFSFNTATVRTGTLISGEVAHQFDWPVQINPEEVLVASLSPMLFDNAEIFSQTSLGSFGPNEVVKGFRRRGRTQVSLGIAQLLGPRFGADNALLAVDFGYVHVHDLPRGQPTDEDSWGYRLVAQLTYNSILGGFTLRPRMVFTHDVDGTTPDPAGAFIEDRKSFTAAVGLEYRRTWTADLGYTGFYDGGTLDFRKDRDFIRFRLIFHY